ncbi:MAG: hypothetical protein HY864_00865 [Chloroflexi bacterium]|nr:hypothetical protein [Chloroflexota bacterium]
MSETVRRFSGNNEGVEWLIRLLLQGNGYYCALVKVGTWSALSGDCETEEHAKDEGCRMMADMLDEVLEEAAHG